MTTLQDIVNNRRFDELDQLTDYKVIPSQHIIPAYQGEYFLGYNYRNSILRLNTPIKILGNYEERRGWWVADSKGNPSYLGSNALIPVHILPKLGCPAAIKSRNDILPGKYQEGNDTLCTYVSKDKEVFAHGLSISITNSSHGRFGGVFTYYTVLNYDMGIPTHATTFSKNTFDQNLMKEVNIIYDELGYPAKITFLDKSGGFYDTYSFKGDKFHGIMLRSLEDPNPDWWNSNLIEQGAQNQEPMNQRAANTQKFFDTFFIENPSKDIFFTVNNGIIEGKYSFDNGGGGFSSTLKNTGIIFKTIDTTSILVNNENNSLTSLSVKAMLTTYFNKRERFYRDENSKFDGISVIIKRDLARGLIMGDNGRPMPLYVTVIDIGYFIHGNKVTAKEYLDNYEKGHTLPLIFGNAKVTNIYKLILEYNDDPDYLIYLRGLKDEILKEYLQPGTRDFPIPKHVSELLNIITIILGGK